MRSRSVSTLLEILQGEKHVSFSRGQIRNCVSTLLEILPQPALRAVRQGANPGVSTLLEILHKV